MHNGASRANRLRASASVRTAVFYGAMLCCSVGAMSTCCVGRLPFCSAGAAPLRNAGMRSTMLCCRSTRLTVELLACGGTAGLNGSTCRSTAADSRIEQQVEAGEVVGGATVVAGGSCRCLAGFRHRLTLPPTVARAAVREREEEGRLLARTNLSRHPLTPPSSPPFLPTQQQVR
ncbi:unnamed protein product [Closterium sp. NIES-54]